MLPGKPVTAPGSLTICPPLYPVWYFQFVDPLSFASKLLNVYVMIPSSSVEHYEESLSVSVACQVVLPACYLKSDWIHTVSVLGPDHAATLCLGLGNHDKLSALKGLSQLHSRSAALRSLHTPPLLVNQHRDDLFPKVLRLFWWNESMIRSSLRCCAFHGCQGPSPLSVLSFQKCLSFFIFGFQALTVRI
jgi:hypothetical protein